MVHFFSSCENKRLQLTPQTLMYSYSFFLYRDFMLCSFFCIRAVLQRPFHRKLQTKAASAVDVRR